MSRVSSIPREAVEATPRKAMTDARRLRIWKAAKGLCKWCGEAVDQFGPRVRYDHFIALALGGAEDDGNVRPLHTRPCDSAKTALDKKLIAKAVRLRNRAAGKKRPSRLRSKPFSRELRKKMDGTVVVRRERP